MKRVNKKLIKYGLIIVGCIFTIPFFVATSHAIFSRDDFMFIQWIEKTWNGSLFKTALSLTAYRWMDSEGRWSTAFYEVFCHPWYWGGEKTLRVWLSFLLLLSVTGLWLLCYAISVYLEIDDSIASVLFITVLLPCLLFEEYYQVYLWFDGSIYQVTTILFEWGFCALLLGVKKSKKSYYVASGIILFLAGGGMPNFIGVICICVISLWVVEFYKKRVINKSLTIVSILVGLSSLITIIAPGNYVRAASISSESKIGEAIWISAKLLFTRYIFFFRETFLSGFLMIIFLCGIHCGRRIKKSRMLWILLVHILMVYATILPYVYGYKKSTWERFDNRAIYFVDITLIMSIELLFFLLGGTIKNVVINSIVAIYILLVSFTVYGVALSDTIPFKITKNYMTGQAQQYIDSWRDVYKILEESDGEVVIEKRKNKRVEGCTNIQFKEDKDYSDNLYLAYTYNLDSVSIVEK